MATIPEEAELRARREALIRAGWSCNASGWWTHPVHATESVSMRIAWARQESLTVMQRVMEESITGSDNAISNGTVERSANGWGPGSGRPGRRPATDSLEHRHEQMRREFGLSARGAPSVLSVLTRHQPTSILRLGTRCSCGLLVRPSPPNTVTSRLDFAAHQVAALADAQRQTRGRTMEP